MAKCPMCGKKPVYDSPEMEKRLRPFCSERCKIADLAGWASEKYRVTTEDSRSSEGEDE